MILVEYHYNEHVQLWKTMLPCIHNTFIYCTKKVTVIFILFFLVTHFLVITYNSLSSFVKIYKTNIVAVYITGP